MLNSLIILLVKLFFVKSCVAKDLTVTASVCIPALPPIDATIGIKKASEIALFLKKVKYKSKFEGAKLASDLNNYKIKLEKKYNIKVDYLEFRDEKNLKLNNFNNKYRLFVAYEIDNVRLIDNY